MHLTHPASLPAGKTSKGYCTIRQTVGKALARESECKVAWMAQKETEQLNAMFHGRGAQPGTLHRSRPRHCRPYHSGFAQSAGYLARATGAHERSLYRMLRSWQATAYFRKRTMASSIIRRFPPPCAATSEGRIAPPRNCSIMSSPVGTASITQFARANRASLKSSGSTCSSTPRRASGNWRAIRRGDDLHPRLRNHGHAGGLRFRRQSASLPTLAAAMDR